MTGSRISTSWPQERPTSLLPTQVNRAVRPDHGATIGSIVAVEGDVITIALPRDGQVRLLVALPGRLSAILARPDLTRFEGHPMALVNPAMGVLGIAFGPPEPQPRLGWMFCCSLRDGEAVDVPGFEGHPSWELLRIMKIEDAGRSTPDEEAGS